MVALASDKKEPLSMFLGKYLFFLFAGKVSGSLLFLSNAIMILLFLATAVTNIDRVIAGRQTS
jgi:hypothetical protein